MANATSSLTHVPASALCGERSVSLSEAWDLACEAALELGLKASFRVLGEDPDGEDPDVGDPDGEDPDRGGNPGATQCRLHYPDGKTASWMMGCGKGHRDVARVGALYEALEHYLTGPEDFRPECLALRSAHRVAAAPELNKDAGTASL